VVPRLLHASLQLFHTPTHYRDSMQGNNDTSVSELDHAYVSCPGTSCDYRSSLLLTYHPSMDRDKTKRCGRNGRCTGEPRTTSSDHQIDTYLSPHSFEAVWRTIWIIIGKVRDLCLDSGSRASLEPYCQANFSDTVRIVELAWTRWCSRRHAAAVHELALYVHLSSFLATMRVLQIACELGPTKLITQQLDQAHHEALLLHVFLKDARRLPSSLGSMTIPPPVPLRPRKNKLLQTQRSFGPGGLPNPLL
jgi:hypothetical protein